MLSLSDSQIVEAIAVHVQENMPPDPTGHDWPHVSRVLKNALNIHFSEGGNEFQITLIALTHDLYDHKFFNGSQAEAEKRLFDLLVSYKANPADATEIVKQVFNLSFKNGQPAREPLSKEGKIVQDADRIEAIGAIGIARAFAFGGFKNRLMWNEKDSENSVASPRLREKQEKENTEGTTFQHFFEKLLRLYDLLNTEAAKKIAKERFEFMQDFVKRFEQEWNN